MHVLFEHPCPSAEVKSLVEISPCPRVSLSDTDDPSQGYLNFQHRRSLDLAWLWLWHRPAAAAPIELLAQELPYAAGVVIKRKEGRRKGRREES